MTLTQGAVPLRPRYSTLEIIAAEKGGYMVRDGDRSMGECRYWPLFAGTLDSCLDFMREGMSLPEQDQ